MQRWNDLGQIPPDFGPCVVTLGNFDGVHRGHRYVLQSVLEQASRRGVPSVAVTFDPHPLEVLFPDRAPQHLTSLDQRLALIEAVGLDAVLVQPFTTDLAKLTPREYVELVFVGALRAELVVVGQDTRFGVKNSGDVHTLAELGAEHGFEVIALDDLGEGRRWSSTMVREQLLAGRVDQAASILGRPHRVSGTVVHGFHRGRELGYPTANLGHDSDGLVPDDGVYAGWFLRLDLPEGAPDRVLPAAISVGTNPTFEGTRRTVEAYVLDRTDLDLYGEHVAIEFVEHLRPTLKFDSIEALLEVMADDVERTRSVLTTIVPEHVTGQ
ncbi:bifunctional riboflavin kinase/FAD synthetase [Arsenicicoccus piscis]|uniref:Riboflavin biosynthesis protein n=1 Tax=Arsenicicoccus piscis TaxID=673954 RepID=A0ABQ6HMR8_9MICO|nr:bifunctional riboflavin kinase/FAD synthetase [Arsenicicoccus piscis]MCH8627237.1 bifunctional riboflavin kinase/FAD synthetase [Arsenicicoccus piscis]GMA18784.1 riboflavin biosynthesis protein [Arsenicicoccus piscis]